MRFTQESDVPAPFAQKSRTSRRQLQAPHRRNPAVLVERNSSGCDATRKSGGGELLNGYRRYLEIGRQGLVAQQQGLQTTSNNIANANTPGYSRQRAVLQTNPTAKSGNAFLGGGVDVHNILRVHDGFIQNQILEESRQFGSYKTRSDELKQIETIVNNDGFRVGDLVNKFYADVRDLASSPEQAALRANVAHSAEARGRFSQAQ